MKLRVRFRYRPCGLAKLNEREVPGGAESNPNGDKEVDTCQSPITACRDVWTARTGCNADWQVWEAPLREQPSPREWDSAAQRLQAGRTGVKLPSVTSDITSVMCQPMALALRIPSPQMCNWIDPAMIQSLLLSLAICVLSPLSVHIPLPSECREIK